MNFLERLLQTFAFILMGVIGALGGLIAFILMALLIVKTSYRPPDWFFWATIISFPIIGSMLAVQELLRD